MKKIVAGLLSFSLCIPLLCGCQYMSQNKQENTDSTPVQALELGQIPSDHPNAEKLSGESAQLRRKDYVDNCFSSNEYDAWLHNVINNDLMPLGQAYTQYYALWQDELTFTVQMAERLFEDDDAYLSWKVSLEEWMRTTEDGYQQEMMQLHASLSRWELLGRYGEIVRQKVLDTKYFCYTLESQLIWFGEDEMDKYASLRFKYEPPTYHVETDFAKG